LRKREREETNSTTVIWQVVHGEAEEIGARSLKEVDAAAKVNDRGTIEAKRSS
jgi:hypothetical protein